MAHTLGIDRRVRLCGIMALGAALLVSACGSDDGEPGTTVGDGPSSTSGASTSSATTSGTPPGADSVADDQADDQADDGNTLPCTGGATYEPETLPNGVVGEPYDATITVTSPAGWEVDAYGELPPGIEIDVMAGTIQVSGVPEMAGEFEITAALDNGDGGQCGEAQTFALVIEPADGSSSTGADGSTGGTGTGA